MGNVERVARCAVTVITLSLSAHLASAQQRGQTSASAPREPIAVRIVEMPAAAAVLADAASDPMPNRSEQLTEYDLSAQLRSAQAAEEQVGLTARALDLARAGFWLSLAALLVSVIGTAALIRSLRLTRDATGAAVKSAESAEKALAREHEAEANSRKALARSLYLELSRQAARRCYDGERGWRALRRKEGVGVDRLRKFVPDEPAIFKALAGRLADLTSDSATALMAFYYRVDALRRDIENTAAAAEDSRFKSGSSRLFGAVVPSASLRMLSRRQDECLAPALAALHELGAAVEDADRLDQRSLASFDSVTADSTPPGTLRERLQSLIDERANAEPSDDFDEDEDEVL